MTHEQLLERQTILQLAKNEASRKRDECQQEINELDGKLTTMTQNGKSFAEKDKVVDSMLYLQKCRDGWQDTINHIRAWQDELKM